MTKENRKNDHVRSIGIKLDDDNRVKIIVEVMSKLKPIPRGNQYQEIYY